MKPLVRQLVPGQGNAAHQMPRTVAQQAAELWQSREVREFNGSIGLDQRKLVKSLPDVAPLAAVQLDKLAKAGYIEVEKTFRGKIPCTVCRITDAGRDAFAEYVEALQSYIKR